MGTDELPASSIGDLDDLVRLHWPRVYRFALASLHDPDAAGSIAQDCFLRLYRSRDRFRGECSLVTWIMQIAANLIKDHARNRGFQFWRKARNTAVAPDVANLFLADPHLTPEQAAVARERVRAVWESATFLTERQRTVFLLRFVEDMDIREIATATGLKEGTVKIHLFRAVESVRQRIGRPE